MSDLYDHDFHAWANEQAGLLREGRLPAADVANIAEELESLGRRERGELTNRLTVLLLHLLKWRHQPERRGRSWQITVASQRDAIAEHIEENPSLRPLTDALLAKAYRRARFDAAREIDMAVGQIPEQCPWTFSQAMTDAPPGPAQGEL